MERLSADTQPLGQVPMSSTISRQSTRHAGSLFTQLHEALWDFITGHRHKRGEAEVLCSRRNTAQCTSPVIGPVARLGQL